MARTTRIVLDMALVSLEKVRPAVAKAWCSTKYFVKDTRAEPILCNRFVSRVELALDNLTGSLWLKLRSLRDKQLPAEAEYLEKELKKVKKKLGEEKHVKSPDKL
ncbi:unnamed protein product [Chrysodeixis includens]|uniref:Uncharacterized protein n=1 Tax=Chrysodeixis includens TaxID=689277 RepID=A0A9N8KS58_CHRIL|nr:unnamed protein product [Chrysodeixis includens]